MLFDRLLDFGNDGWIDILHDYLAVFWMWLDLCRQTTCSVQRSNECGYLLSSGVVSRLVWFRYRLAGTDIYLLRGTSLLLTSRVAFSNHLSIR